MLMKTKSRRQWRNRAGSVLAQPNHYSYPINFEQIQSEVLRAAEEGQRLRVAGSGRSFSPLCWTDENLMSLQQYQGVERWTSDRGSVWVRSGTTLSALALELATQGLALENWQGPGSQTLGGALSAGAYSSGLAYGSLSAQVTGLHMVCADGSAKTIDAENSPQFLDAARLSLGALGVITHAELRCVPIYHLRSISSSGRLYDLLPQMAQQLTQNRGFGFQWFPHTGMVQTQSYNPTDAALTPQHPLRAVRQAAVLGAKQWTLAQATRHLPLLSKRVKDYGNKAPERTETTVLSAHPSTAARNLLRYQEIEYALPITQLTDALTQMERVIRALGFPAHMPLEIRFAKADALWLSPTQGHDCAFIAVRVPQGLAHSDYFSAMTEIAERHDGRPCWGGLHGKTAQELRPLYPRFDEFLGLRQQLDPRGVFLNPHLCELFGIEQL